MVTWILIALIILVVFYAVWQTAILVKHTTAIEGFSLLLEKFIEVNQGFYENQKSVAKKDKEVLEGLSKQTSELSILRRYNTQIGMSVRNLTESTKSLKETQKNTKETSEELKVSKDIASSLASVSNNIRLLDKIASELKNSIDKLNRRN